MHLLEHSSLHDVPLKRAQASPPDSNFLTFNNKFRIHYFFGNDSINNVPNVDSLTYHNGILSSGADGIPDFPQYVAFTLDSVYKVTIDSFGFKAPANSITDVHIEDLDSLGNKYYGFASFNPMELFLENDFMGFLDNTSDYAPPIKAFDFYKVTCAHEFFHLIQFGYYSNLSTANNFFFEPSAVWMEEMVFDSINDYTQYLISGTDLFSSPSASLDGGDFYNNYDRVIWPLFLSDFLGTNGIKTIKKVWEIYGNTSDPSNTFSIFDSAISFASSNEFNMSGLFTEFSNWVQYCNFPHPHPHRTFEEEKLFPNYKFTSLPFEKSDRIKLNPLSFFGAKLLNGRDGDSISLNTFSKLPISSYNSKISFSKIKNDSLITDSNYITEFGLTFWWKRTNTSYNLIHYFSINNSSSISESFSIEASYQFENEYQVFQDDFIKAYPVPAKTSVHTAIYMGYNPNDIRNLDTTGLSCNIFSSDGNHITTLQTPDNNSSLLPNNTIENFFKWDLRNNLGKIVAPGVFFYIIKGLDSNVKGKLLITR